MRNMPQSSFPDTTFNNSTNVPIAKRQLSFTNPQQAKPTLEITNN